MPDIKRRALSYGSSTVITTVIFMGILVFAALIAERHPWRVDLTESKSFSLSQQTLNILKTIDKPLKIIAFFATASPEESKARDLLDIYRYNNKNIELEFVDPDARPDVAKRYDVRMFGTLVLEGYGKTRTVQAADEEGITNAIYKLSRNEQKKVYFLSGHGECSTSNTEREGCSIANEALQKAGYGTADLTLLQQPEIPEDAAVIIVAGPAKPLFPKELDILRAYIGRGGRLMVLLDAVQDGGMRDFLPAYGLQFTDDIIVDRLSRVFGGNELMPVVMDYGSHRITENFGVATFFPEARSIRQVEPPPEGVTVETLASSSAQSWAEFNLELIKKGQASFDEGTDVKGPVPLAAIAEIMTGAPSEQKGDQDAPPDEPAKNNRKACVLAVGSSSFLGNSYFGLSGNGDLFLNMVSYLAEEETLIAVTHDQKTPKPMLMSAGQARAIVLTVMLGIPLLVLVSGLVVYRVRRSQQ